MPWFNISFLHSITSSFPLLLNFNFLFRLMITIPFFTLFTIIIICIVIVINKHKSFSFKGEILFTILQPSFDYNLIEFDIRFWFCNNIGFFRQNALEIFYYKQGLQIGMGSIKYNVSSNMILIVDVFGFSD